MNLWLDDVRPAPPGWTWVKTARGALHALATGTVVLASLDHDLGHPTRDGTWLVRQMIRHHLWPHYKPGIHSANPVGAARMTLLIRDYGPYDR